MFGERFAQQANGARVDRVAMAAIRDAADAVFQPARRAEFTHQMAAGRIDVIVVFVLRDSSRHHASIPAASSR